MLNNLLHKTKHVFKACRTEARLLIARVKPHVSMRRALLAGGALLGLSVVLYGVYFYWPRSVSFSFAQNSTCFSNPVLLPKLISTKPSPAYRADFTHYTSLRGYPLYSRTTCVSPRQAPTAGQTETIAFTAIGQPVFKKNIRITTGSLPTPKPQFRLDRPVSTKQPLRFAMPSTDHVFNYQLTIQGQQVPCVSKNAELSCNLDTLNLSQSAKYDFKLQRLFRGRPSGTVSSGNLATAEAIHIVSSSIAPGQTVYNIPTEITLTLNRPAKSYTNARLYLVTGDKRQEVATTATLKDTLLTIRLTAPLVRSATFALVIVDLTAPDGGYLIAPYSIGFVTSGGPKVKAVSIGGAKVSPSASIALTFDSAISPTQNVGQFVRLEANGATVGASIVASGKTITIRPAGALPRCAALTVHVLDGLQNDAGVSGGSAYTFRSRVLCQTVFGIGTSVQGRGITAYSFGNGPSKIVFVGGTHGNEQSSTYILTRLVDYLELNPGRIPAHRTIVIIPNINPDGSAANRRTNANNVDLNRNFPSNSWKSGVTMPDKSYLATGGGTAPLSEPESRALANYVLAQRPRLVLTYHATGGVVVPNDSGDSGALAGIYARSSSVYFLPNGQTGTFFEYDTTGAFEDWLHDKPGLPALLVELNSKTGVEFSGHQNAILSMIQLP